MQAETSYRETGGVPCQPYNQRKRGRKPIIRTEQSIPSNDKPSERAVSGATGTAGRSFLTQRYGSIKNVTLNYDASQRDYLVAGTRAYFTDTDKMKQFVVSDDPVLDICKCAEIINEYNNSYQGHSLNIVKVEDTDLALIEETNILPSSIFYFLNLKNIEEGPYSENFKRAALRALVSFFQKNEIMHISDTYYCELRKSELQDYIEDEDADKDYCKTILDDIEQLEQYKDYGLKKDPFSIDELYCATEDDQQTKLYDILMSYIEVLQDEGEPLLSWALLESLTDSGDCNMATDLFSWYSTDYEEDWIEYISGFLNSGMEYGGIYLHKEIREDYQKDESNMVDIQEVKLQFLDMLSEVLN